MQSATLISVIIPLYNAEYFIEDTVNSVLSQSFQNFEIIIIDDGSIDNVEEKLSKFTDKRITYLKKPNTGVADTRNQGLRLAQGNFVLFLDADDVLSPAFLQSRIDLLQQKPSFGFCCGKVYKIDETGKRLPGLYRGTHTNIVEEILLYDPYVITCPSNYLIRKSLLNLNNLKFNTQLSSTADRFFLIEVAAFGKGGFVEKGELLYRVSQFSMSHKLSAGLVDDNLIFYKLVSAKKYIPKVVFKKFSFKISYILGAAYINLKSYPKGLYYLTKSILLDPKCFIYNVYKKFN